MSSCLSSNCTSAEQAAASQQSTQECAFGQFIPPPPSPFSIFAKYNLSTVTASGVQSTINNPTPTGAAIGKMNVLGGGVAWGAVVAIAGAAVGAGLTL